MSNKKNLSNRSPSRHQKSIYKQSISPIIKKKSNYKQKQKSSNKEKESLSRRQGLSESRKSTIKRQLDDFDQQYKQSVKYSRSQPATNTRKSLFKALSQSYVPKRIPCRQKQQKQIQDFIREAMLSGYSSQVLYIAGVPGLGKTATVKNVLNKIQNEQNFKKEKIWIVQQNAMKLKHPDKIFKHLLQKLSGITKSTQQSTNILNEYFQRGFHKLIKVPKDAIIILVIDQMDYLQTPENEVIYTIVEWLRQYKRNLSIIGISNTIDLPQTFSTKIQSRFGNKRIIFPQYTSQQIGEILKSRLEKYQGVFQPQAIDYIARKMGGHQTDIRKCLQILRSAIDKHLNANKLQNPQFLPIKDISLNTLKQAINELFSDSFIDSWQQFPMKYKQVLYAMAHYFRNQTSQLIYSQLERMLGMGTKFNKVHQLRSILFDLRDLDLISINQKIITGRDRRVYKQFEIHRNVQQQYLRLKVHPDQIFLARQNQQRKPQLNFYDQFNARMQKVYQK